MPNLELVPKKNLSSFRKIALGTWRTAYDPSVYGCLRLDAGKMLDWLDAFRAATGRRITLTHLLVKAIATVFAEMPDANAIVRWNKIWLRKDIGVFFQVAMTDEQTGEIDLSGVTIHGADQKSLLEILDETEERVAKVRAGKDKDLEGTRSTFKKLPYFLLFPLLQAIGFLTYTLNLDLRFAGIPKDPFGSVMLTNVGSLGLQEAYVPLVPYSRVALLVAVGTVEEEAVVRNGEIEIGRILRLFATFDHRILDGSHAAKMSRILQAIFEDPAKYFGEIPGAS